jgi:hypothetical protein
MKKELNAYIASHKSFGEIELFREMQDVLKKKYKCILIEETHQNYVSYTSPSVSSLVKKEISDLWIIAYSPKRKKSRMTFLQAKYKKRSHNNSPTFTFAGDYFQYELLSTRPDIVNHNRFGFPTNILSFTNYHSIGTFGVFYYDSDNKLDMAYCIASHLLCKNKPVKKGRYCNRQLEFPLLSTCQALFIASCSTKMELCSSLSVNIFVRSVLGLVVGAPIDNNPDIQSFLSSFFQTLNKTLNNNVVQDFLNFLGGTNITTQAQTDSNRNSPRILLINVDENG